MATRPEHEAPPEVFYNDTTARQYASNSRMIEIQTAMAERAVELLAIPENSPPLLLLDLGCGSGLSGQVITDDGHMWVGLDISPSMLGIAHERQVAGELVLRDLGDGLPFRAGTFDGVISVSALQWLCNADKAWHNPVRRMRIFFESLFACMKRSARAVFQVYPETPQQMEMLTAAAMRAGFTGGLLVDYPNSTKAKKYYLTLFAGPAPSNFKSPEALGEGDEVGDDGEGEGEGRNRRRKTGGGAMFVDERDTRHGGRRGAGAAGKKVAKGSREWVLKKKEKRRAQGKDVRPDSKYTARKRRRAV